MAAAIPVSTQTVQRLWQLQEYEITLREERIVHGEDASVAALDESIKAIRAQVDSNVLARYDRMARQRPAVVQIHTGMCMGCNMVIPKGDLVRIANGKAEPLCPHCSAYIVLPAEGI